MKDYIETIEEKKDFILYFDETDEELFVHYASRKILSIENTKTNKRNLLNKMEEQVNNAKEYKEEWVEQEKENKKNILYKIIRAGVYSLVVFGIFYVSYVYFGVVIVCHILPAIKYYTKMKQTQIRLKDLEKNEMYLEFNKIREEEAKRILDETRELAKDMGASEKAIEQIPQELKDLDEEININTIHRLDYLQMKQLLKNAKALRKMQFFALPDQLVSEENENPKTFQEKWQEYTPIKEETPYTFRRKWKIKQAKEEQNSK